VEEESRRCREAVCAPAGSRRRCHGGQPVLGVHVGSPRLRGGRPPCRRGRDKRREDANRRADETVIPRREAETSTCTSCFCPVHDCRGGQAPPLALPPMNAALPARAHRRVPAIPASIGKLPPKSKHSPTICVVRAFHPTSCGHGRVPSTNALRTSDARRRPQAGAMLSSQSTFSRA
jgi:hypothetical protein